MQPSLGRGRGLSIPYVTFVTLSEAAAAAMQGSVVVPGLRKVSQLILLNICYIV